MKALTMLEQLALPVELNATLEPAADFAKASTAPATGGPAGASLGIASRSGSRHRGQRLMPSSAWTRPFHRERSQAIDPKRYSATAMTILNFGPCFIAMCRA